MFTMAYAAEWARYGTGAGWVSATRVVGTCPALGFAVPSGKVVIR